MRISDWSSDVCSSDLWGECSNGGEAQIRVARDQGFQNCQQVGHARLLPSDQITVQLLWVKAYQSDSRGGARRRRATTCCHSRSSRGPKLRSEEHTSELQSLMRISYAVFCLKKKKKK